MVGNIDRVALLVAARYGQYCTTIVATEQSDGTSSTAERYPAGCVDNHANLLLYSRYCQKIAVQTSRLKMRGGESKRQSLSRGIVSARDTHASNKN